MLKTMRRVLVYIFAQLNDCFQIKQSLIEISENYSKTKVSLYQLTKAETVKSRDRISLANVSTRRRVLQKITALVIVRVSYKSQSVSNFHS